MKFAFGRWILIFSILILGCQYKVESQSGGETGLPNTFTLTYESLVRLLEESGTDRESNEYSFYNVGEGANYLGVQLFDNPDIELLLQLKDYIHKLGIFTPLTDIAFLEDFHRLRYLAIANQDILNFEPVGTLSGLEWLRIDNYDPVSIDCSIFANLKNLGALMFSTDRIINLEAIFDKEQDDIKLPKLDFISIGKYEYSKNSNGYFMVNVEGLTPSDRNRRVQYGNMYAEKYIDQYENRFNGEYYYNEYKNITDKISVEILHTPDFEVLSSVADNIIYLTIEDTSPITDIAFLENSAHLEKLSVRTSAIETFEPLKNSFTLKNLEIRNPSIEAIESLRLLNHLSSLKIAVSLNMDFLKDNSNGNALDFLYSIRDIANLNELKLLDSELENTEEMYLLAREMFKIANLEQVGFGDDDFYNNFSKDAWKSYEFELGTYHILQYRANVRAGPSRNNDSVAIIKLHDEVEILENTFVEEKINNVWGFWYKIKCGNITGYTFGGNIAYKALVADIDKNGINDHFYWRYSQGEYGGVINPFTDVIIHINDRRINTNVIGTTEGSLSGRPYEWCILEEGDDDVLIGLVSYGRHSYEYMTIFKVNPNGRIEYLQNWDEIDYW